MKAAMSFSTLKSLIACGARGQRAQRLSMGTTTWHLSPTLLGERSPSGGGMLHLQGKRDRVLLHLLRHVHRLDVRLDRSGRHGCRRVMRSRRKGSAATRASMSGWPVTSARPQQVSKQQGS